VDGDGPRTSLRPPAASCCEPPHAAERRGVHRARRRYGSAIRCHPLSATVDGDGRADLPVQEASSPATRTPRRRAGPRAFTSGRRETYPVLGEYRRRRDGAEPRVLSGRDLRCIATSARRRHAEAIIRLAVKPGDGIRDMGEHRRAVGPGGIFRVKTGGVSASS